MKALKKFFTLLPYTGTTSILNDFILEQIALIEKSFYRNFLSIDPFLSELVYETNRKPFFIEMVLRYLSGKLFIEYTFLFMEVGFYYRLIK